MKTIRKIIELSNELGIDTRELYTNIIELNDDFEVENYRFIKESEAESILVDIYKCDEYILGCFSNWFISTNCNIPYNCVCALQKAEAYSELGELMLDNGIDDLISECIRLDGYGHAFGSYDGDNEEITLNDELYIYFRTN